MSDAIAKDRKSLQNGQPSGLTVYFDGACPLCRREIDLYRNLPARETLCFLDVSQSQASGAESSAEPLSRAALLAQFHVRDAEGHLHSGARAFLKLWAVLPGWRWLARMGSLPGMPTVLEWGYQVFLRARPGLQRLVRWWDSRQRSLP